ncbi:hypothetical protein BDQ17DRAFT_1346172 [Cyathus striatus]|nr:hypothetical protein BDQ17DRAFT_1346172 [Cyathus striatus]
MSLHQLWRQQAPLVLYHHNAICMAPQLLCSSLLESRGFGFVTVETSEEADAAITALNTTEIVGKVVTIENVIFLSLSLLLALADTHRDDYRYRDRDGERGYGGSGGGRITRGMVGREIMIGGIR